MTSTSTGLRILVAGRVSGDLRRDLSRLDAAGEILDVDPRDIAPATFPSLEAHLVVLGEGAPFSAAHFARWGAGMGPPVLALGDDPEADLATGRDGLAPVVALRLAGRLARMQRALLAARRAGILQEGEEIHAGAEPFNERLEYEFSRALRYRHPVSLVTLSIDDRQSLSALYGESAVAEFLPALGETLRRSLRDVDLLYRPRLEEFAAILPETAAAGARLVADRLLAQTSRLVFKPSLGSRPMLPLKATSSIGVADGPGEQIRTPGELLERARGSMRAAQLSGGGRVVLHGPPPISAVP